MNRLTIKDEYLGRFVSFSIKKNMAGEAVSKLVKLEDIEDELGIDLITLFKALKNGFFYKDNSEIKYADRDIVIQRYARKLEIVSKFNFDGFLDEYGKTWALTEKELEK